MSINQRWATASPEFAAIMAGLEKSAIAKAAAAAVDAADMVTDSGAQQGQPGQPGPADGGQQAPAPEPSMSDMLAQIAQQEPDQAAQQVIMDAAQRFAMIDSPPMPQEQAQDPNQQQPPAQAGPPQAQPQQAPPGPAVEQPPKTASSRFAQRVPASASGGTDTGANFSTDRYLAFLRAN